jgi:hypothetical protein
VQYNGHPIDDKSYTVYHPQRPLVVTKISKYPVELNIGENALLNYIEKIDSSDDILIINNQFVDQVDVPIMINKYGIDFEEKFKKMKSFDEIMFGNKHDIEHEEKLNGNETIIGNKHDIEHEEKLDANNGNKHDIEHEENHCQFK